MRAIRKPSNLRPTTVLPWSPRIPQAPLKLRCCRRTECHMRQCSKQEKKRHNQANYASDDSSSISCLMCDESTELGPHRATPNPCKFAWCWTYGKIYQSNAF